MENSNPQNYEFTKLSYEAVRKRLNENAKLWHSFEEVSSLINLFREERPDAKADPQEKIVHILSTCNSCTNYKDDHGISPLCLEYSNSDAVAKAADEYVKYASKLPRTNDFDKLFYNEIKEICQEHRSASDYMTRLVRRRMQKISPELIKEGDSTRLLIFKQFLRASEICSSKRIYRVLYSEKLKKYVLDVMKLNDGASESEINKAIADLDDSVFSIMKETPTENQEKKNFKDYYLPLFWADDLANGKFSKQGSTRSKLYWLAIILDMAYYFEEEDGFEERDIQINLFYNYYSDSLLNSLIGNGIEDEVSGKGINFNNFYEVCYLYYINKKDLSPRDKLKKARDMIDRCKVDPNDAVTIKFQEEKHAFKGSTYYEPLVKKIMNYSEAELEKFIKSEYICGTTSNSNMTKISSESKTATAIYKELLKQFKVAVNLVAEQECNFLTEEDIYFLMEKDYFTKTKCKNCKVKPNNKMHSDCPLYASNCKGTYKPVNQAKKMRETGMNERNRLSQENLYEILRKTSDIYYEQSNAESTDDQTNRILEAVKEKYSFSIVTSGTVNKGTKVIFNTSGPNVTRSKLIVLYYYIYVVSHWNSKLEAFNGDSFLDFQEDFCENFTISCNLGKDQEKTFNGLNDILIASGYQGFSFKNIFDFLTLTMAFKNNIKYK